MDGGQMWMCSCPGGPPLSMLSGGPLVISIWSHLDKVWRALLSRHPNAPGGL